MNGLYFLRRLICLIRVTDSHNYLIKKVNNWLHRFIDFDLQDIIQNMCWPSGYHAY